MDSEKHGFYTENNDGEEIAGDEDNNIRILQNLQRIQEGLKPGAKITIVGQVLANACRIDVDLCEKASGQPKVLHFNPRFTENRVVRNSCGNGGWGTEERFGRFLFKPGNVFKLVIRCEKEQFHFMIDDTDFGTYKYRQPVKNCKYLRILGSVSVIHVDVRN